MQRAPSPGLGVYEEAVAERVEALASSGIVRRIWERDATLWGGPQETAAIANRLGWLDAPGSAAHARGDYEAFAAALQDDGCSDVVVLGMGGSSLCPEVLRRTFRGPKGGARLHVLDTTDPESVLELEERVDLPQTAFLVSTKSGTTIETLSLQRYFEGRLRQRGVEKPAAAFTAITDPGTSLEATAKRDGYRAILPGIPDVGGRYSALTAFGLVPAAVLQIPLESVLGRVQQMVRECQREDGRNPGLMLGATLAELTNQGRDKVTLVADPPFDSIGLWLEQLLAESLGKRGKGLVPVAGEPLGDPSQYRDDRLFVHLALPGAGDANRDALEGLADVGHPVVRLELADPFDLFVEFFRWEFATAVAAATLGVNAFDEPNVSESKENTAAVLDEGARVVGADVPKGGPRARVTACHPEPEGVAPDAEQLRAWLDARAPGSYLAIQAYLPENDATVGALDILRQRARRRSGLATTVGMGPRFLHSTGQLHKGGPPTGAFLQILRRRAPVVTIPEAAYDFATLQRAQAEGDARSLASRGLPLVRITLEETADLQLVADWLG